MMIGSPSAWLPGHTHDIRISDDIFLRIPADTPPGAPPLLSAWLMMIGAARTLRLFCDAAATSSFAGRSAKPKVLRRWRWDTYGTPAAAG